MDSQQEQAFLRLARDYCSLGQMLGVISDYAVRSLESCELRLKGASEPITLSASETAIFIRGVVAGFRMER